MRVTFQPSTGRGEYEICEYAANGLGPSQLLDHFMTLKIDTISFNTSVKLTKDQGKFRLRVDPKGACPQVPNQVAYALLMPKAIREEGKTEFGHPVLQNDAYIIKNINLGNVELTGAASFAADILTIDGQNQGNHVEQIPVILRMQQIQRIWQSRTQFPATIASLLGQHEQMVRSGRPIPFSGERLVSSLQSAVEAYSEDVEIPYSSRTDVVPALLSMLNEVVQEPVALEEIDPGMVELRRREIKKWQIFASRRGAASVKFRKEVQRAYNYRCIMCGCRFPPTTLNKKPGVDAAHIIPYSRADLDEVYNGIALCKTHHWAFDERILVITYQNGVYYVELSAEAAKQLAAPNFSVDQLQTVVGPIPVERLPALRAHWPRPALLDRLQSDTAEVLV